MTNLRSKSLDKENFHQNLSNALGQELLVDLLNLTTSTKDYIQTIKDDAIKEFCSVPRSSIVTHCEDLSVPQYASLRLIKPLKSILPSNICTLRDEESQDIFNFLPEETPNGCCLSSELWVKRIVSDLVRNRSLNDIPSFIEVAWTVDYAKCGWTFSGFQPVGLNINPNSSTNYAVNNCYFATDCNAKLKINCIDSFNWLNESTSFIVYNIEQIPFQLKIVKSILNDFPAMEAVLGKKCKCFFCNLDVDSSSDYKISRLYDTSLKIYTTRDLTKNLREYYPNSLIDVELFLIKLDWGFHGWKRLVNNYLSAVFKSWEAKVNNKEKGTQLALFGYLMRKYINPKYRGLINGSFKLSMTIHILLHYIIL